MSDEAIGLLAVTHGVATLQSSAASVCAAQA